MVFETGSVTFEVKTALWKKEICRHLTGVIGRIKDGGGLLCDLNQGRGVLP